MDRAELAGKQGWFQLSKSCPCKGERENKGAHQFIIARQASIFVSSQPYHIGGIIHEQSIHSPTNSACQYAPACVYKSSLHTLIVSMTAEPLDEDASTKDYIRGGSLMRANKGVRVVSEGVTLRWNNEAFKFGREVVGGAFRKRSRFWDPWKGDSKGAFRKRFRFWNL
eukprot:1149680-Pelagomonas_calceolata.AAC.2